MLLQKLFLILLFFINSVLFAYPNYSEAIKEKQIYPLGKKIYNTKCSKLDPLDYKSFEAVREAINQEKNCKSLQVKYKDALALYIWEKKRVQKSNTQKYPILKVSHSEKCPICGMFLYKYPRWVSMLEYGNGKKLYFDGVKDLLKYYFQHSTESMDLYARDYYTQKTISLKNAYFVIGSDVYGPMGNELIAFKDRKSAQNFLLDHKGKKIIRLKEITEGMVYKLDD